MIENQADRTLENHSGAGDAKMNGRILRRAAFVGVLAALATFAVASAFVYLNREAFSRVFLGAASAGSGIELPFVEEESAIITTVEKANPSVVSIVVTKDVPIVERYYERLGPLSVLVPQVRERGSREVEVGGGSGFIVSSDGLVVTNKHVIDDPEATYTAFTIDGTKYDVEMVATDPYFDIAILRMLSNKSFPYLEFGDSDTLKLGQTVIAIGNALSEFRNSISVGVVSGLSRSVVAGSFSGEPELLERVIQTDAAINLGNSGGPLLDAQGRVVGINVAVALESENIGFALPANLAKNAVASVKANGRIIRPYIGVRTVPVTPELQVTDSLPVDYGARVTRGDGISEIAVYPDSPASRAGIAEGDIILEVDGERITTETSLGQIIRSKSVGDSVPVKILRDGQEITVFVRLEAAPDNF